MSVIINDQTISKKIQSLTISKKDKDYIIDFIHGDTDVDLYFLDDEFAKKIKDYSDEEVILKIIDFYIDNHIIYGIDESKKEDINIAGYISKFNSCACTKDSNLYIKTSPVIGNINIMNKIKQKYIEDRRKFFNASDYAKKYSYSLNNYSSYNSSYNNNFETHVNISLDDSENDKSFYMNSLNKILESQDQSADIEVIYTCRPPSVNIPVKAIIKCGETEILLDNYQLYDIARDIIDNHNKNIDNSIDMQLKMEGF